MKIRANLFIDRDGSLRVTKRETAANPSELAVQLVVDIPDVFFRRPIPVVELAIPEEYLVNPGAEVVATWVADPIAGALKLDVKTVQDGLLRMLQDKQREEEGR